MAASIAIVLTVQVAVVEQALLDHPEKVPAAVETVVPDTSGLITTTMQAAVVAVTTMPPQKFQLVVLEAVALVQMGQPMRNLVLTVPVAVAAAQRMMEEAGLVVRE